MIPAALLVAAVAVASPKGGDLVNPNFRDGLAGWDAAWSRSPAAVRAAVLPRGGPDGAAAVKIVHDGTADWALPQARTVPARPGEIWELSGRVRTAAERGGTIQLGVVLVDGGGEVRDWIYGSASVSSSPRWRRMVSRFLVPEGVAALRFRLTGDGPCDVRIADLDLHRLPLPAAGRVPDVELASPALTLRVDGTTGTWTVRAPGRTWRQDVTAAGEPVPTSARKLSATSALLDETDPVSGLEFTAEIRLAPDRPELTVELRAPDGTPLAGELRFPRPFVSEPADFIVAPYAEGLLLPVTATGTGWGFKCFAGKNGFACDEWKTAMGFGAVTDLRAGYGMILETPWDAGFAVRQPGGKLALAPVWRGQRATFGYPRRVTYAFTADGGYVALAMRYREFVRARGWLVTLAEKARVRPQVDRLLGATDLWATDGGLPGDLLEDLAASGVDKLLVSFGDSWQGPAGAGAAVRRAEALGWLASRYDILTDVWNPADKPPKWLRTSGFPADVVVNPGGGYHRGWVDKSAGGPFQGYVLCAATHAADARRRIPPELARTPYNARFIDVETASGLFECAAPAHPETRHQDAENRAAALAVVARELKLVTGSEEIRDWAVPFSDYSEGTMSLRPAENAGYDWSTPVDPDDDYRALDAGAAFRVPLFELVFHDAHVASWYTGDGATKVPACWDAKDLLNLLDGTMPLWMPTPAIWARDRERFIASYHVVNAVTGAVAGSAMTSHAFLTPDRMVQRTDFANGTAITVNFGDTDYAIPNDPPLHVLPRNGFQAEGPGVSAARTRFGSAVVTSVETRAKRFLDPGGSFLEFATLGLGCDGPVVLFTRSAGARVACLGVVHRIALSPSPVLSAESLKRLRVFPLGPARERLEEMPVHRARGRVVFEPPPDARLFDLTTD